MNEPSQIVSADQIEKNRDKVLAIWMERLAEQAAFDDSLIGPKELSSESEKFFSVLLPALSSGNASDITAEEYEPVRSLLTFLSESRVARGFSPSGTALFIFTLKNIVLSLVQESYKDDIELLQRETLVLSKLMDELGLFTIEQFTKSREDLITRQQKEIMEISTPVIQLWDGILSLPVIGTLDTFRTQSLMESLLNAIVDTGSTIAILDISGVPTVDSMVAQHLLKTAAAAKLMGASCIISGIRPEIAQTMVQLGIDLSEVRTTSTMASALEMAFSNLKLQVVGA